MQRHIFRAIFLTLTVFGVTAAIGCAKPSSGETKASGVSPTDDTAVASTADQKESSGQGIGSPDANLLAQKEPAADEKKTDEAKKNAPKENDEEKKKQEAAREDYEKFAKPFFKELNEKFEEAQKGKEVDFAPLVKKYSERLATKSSVGEIRDAIETAQMLEIFSSTDNVKPIYQGIEKLADRIQGSEPELAKKIHEALKSPIARLNLVGTKPVIEGTTVDGEKFDWSKYKGKVVLLDFWATWCGPCVKEMPNVKKAYEKYHEKGFEVVGISLDNSKDDLVAFIKEKNVPWTTIYPDTLSDKFLVEGIPATFLFDRDGKLVSISARGPRLEQQLEKLLEKKK